jgi:endo-1,4-beta-xylanase
MIAVSRRRLMQMAAAGVATANGRVAAAAPKPSLDAKSLDATSLDATSLGATSLGAIAAQNGYLFGAAAAEVIDSDAAYRDLYITQTKIITTDVALKIGRIAPQPGPKHFESADRLLAFCNQHNIAMRGHCLVWNEWNPDWVKNMSASERRTYFDSYIEEVVGRYQGKLQSWDIVNEPFWPGHRAPGGFR